MSMSRKDFVLLARAIKEVREGTSEEQRQLVDHVAKRIASAIDQSSATFQKGRFLEACGVPE